MDSEVSAAEAELRYISENLPGYQRKLKGRGFCYIDPNGSFVKDNRFLARFKQLRIPPLHGKKFGSVPGKIATFRRRAVTTGVESNISIIRAGMKS